MFTSIPTGTGTVTSAGPASGVSATVPKPTATVDGDVLVVPYFHHTSGGTLTPPDGTWESVGINGTTVGSFNAWVKPIADADAEPATYTFTRTSGSDRQNIMCFRVPGAETGNPLDVHGALVNTGTDSIIAPSVDDVVTDAGLLVAVWVSSRPATPASTITPPAGMTPIGSVASGTTSTSVMAVAAQILTAAGDTGSRTATVSPTGNAGTAFMFVLRPRVTMAADLTAAAALTPAGGNLDAVAGAELDADADLTATIGRVAGTASADLSAEATLTATLPPPAENVLLEDGTWGQISHYVLDDTGTWN